MIKKEMKEDIRETENLLWAEKRGLNSNAYEVFLLFEGLSLSEWSASSLF